MFRFRIAVSLIAVFAFAYTARALPITLSLENGTFSTGATLSGTVVIDTATGSLLSTDLTYNRNGTSLSFAQPFYSQTTIPPIYNVYYWLQYGAVEDGTGSPFDSPATVDEFDLLIPTASLVGYGGGPICTLGGVDSYVCGGGVYSEYYGRVNFTGDYGFGAGADAMTTGNLVPVTTTPEPASLILVLTGQALCGVVASRRRRPL